MTWFYVGCAVWGVVGLLIYVYTLEKALYVLECTNKQLRKDLDELCYAHLDLKDATVGKGYRDSPPRKNITFEVRKELCGEKDAKPTP